MRRFRDCYATIDPTTKDQQRLWDPLYTILGIQGLIWFKIILTEEAVACCFAGSFMSTHTHHSNHVLSTRCEAFVYILHSLWFCIRSVLLDSPYDPFRCIALPPVTASWLPMRLQVSLLCFFVFFFGETCFTRPPNRRRPLSTAFAAWLLHYNALGL